MPRARGEDETVRSGDVDHSGAQTLAAGVAPSATTPALPVVAVENYVRIDEYARGGLGRIIRAKDERTGRYVAIKEMLADDGEAARRFVREAVVTANLQHPAIVPVYEVGQWPDGQPFFAMKLVRGRALNEVIAATEDLDGRLALVSHVAAVADALAYAHGERVIHRDLKPHNVLCGAFGETVVIDWGLARRLDETEEGAPALHDSPGAAVGETHAGAVMGTPSYMSPEQARGERADQQSDVYAIGAILYHLLAGRPPHIDRDVDTLLQRVRDATPDALPAEVPRDLAAIVEQAMARDRAKRYPSAAELASDLRRFMTGQLVLAHHYTRRQRLARFVSRHRGAVAVAGVALAIVAVVATFAIRGILTARGEATASRDEARARLVTSYVDRAGLELVNGQPARSLAYTIASAQVAGLTPQTRLMAAHALDQLPPLRWRSESKPGFAMFAPGSHDLLLAVDDLVRWNPDTDRVVWTMPWGVHGGFKLVGRDTLAFVRDSSIALVKVADGEPAGELQGSTGSHYRHVAMDESARWLAAKSDRWIDLFDTTTRALVASIPFSSGSLSQVAGDGEHVIAVVIAPTVWVLDRAGKVVATFEAELGNVVVAGDELVYASPPDKSGISHLVVGDWSGQVRLDLPIGPSPIHALAVDVAAKRVALGTEDGVVQVRSLVSGEASWQTTLGDRTAGVVFDGSVLRALSSSAAVGFDVTSGLELERASIAGGNVLAASDDHARVAVVAYGAGFAVWAPARREFMPVASTAANVSDVVFAPDGTAIAAGDDVRTLARLDDGTMIAAGTDGTIVVRDRNGHELRRFASGAVPRPSPDGRQIAAAMLDGTVAIWDTATGTNTRALGKLAHVQSIRWSRDGSKIAGVTNLGAVSVWSVGGSVIREIPAGNFTGNVWFSNDGHWLARAGEPADRLFALDGGSDRTLLDARSKAAVVAAFSPDDRTVLVAGMGFLWTWDVATAVPRLRIAAGGWITAAAFVGDYIIAGGSDRRIHVWNADSGAELLAFTVPAQPRKIVVDRSGTRVAILAGRGAIVWTIPAFSGTLEDLRERAKCRVDVEVVDAQLRAHPIDIAACNRVATEPPK